MTTLVVTRTNQSTRLVPEEPDRPVALPSSTGGGPMIPRTITVSSRALGRRVFVTVKVYDTVEQMVKAGRRYNGNHSPDAIGLTQVSVWEDGRTKSVIVRLVRGRLSTQIVVHEMHHAATAWYGSSVNDAIVTRDHLHHHNEPFAHLQSDLTCRLVDRLYALGYYDRQESAA